MMIIKWMKPRKAKVYHITIVENGKLTHDYVDDIVIDEGYGITVGGKEDTRGTIITKIPCKVTTIEPLPGIKERVLACTKKAIRELKETVKYI